MLSNITQKNTVGFVTIGTQNSTIDPKICNAPYSFSACIHLSDIMPAIAGINIDEMPMVEKIAPNCAPDQPLF
jgi:hypothetical protein